MSDRLEQDLEELLARRAASTEAELAAQRATIADLPPRHRRPPVIAWAAAVLVAVGLTALAAWRLEVMVAGPAVNPSPSAEATAPAPATVASDADRRRRGDTPRLDNVDREPARVQVAGGADR